MGAAGALVPQKQVVGEGLGSGRKVGLTDAGASK